MPVQRISPNEYFYPQPQTMTVETTQIPDAMWILLGIALIGAFAIALYALKTLGDVKKPEKK